MSSCKPCKPCTPHREMAAWWRAPIIRARIGTGLLFAIRSTQAQVLYLEHRFLMIYWRGWGQMQQCHPLTGRTATHAGANENRWAVCAYSNNKCCGSKSFRIAPYIFSRAASYFLTSKTSLVMLIFFLLFQMCWHHFFSSGWDKNAEYSPLPMTNFHFFHIFISPDIFSN